MRQLMIGIYRSARAFVRPAGAALALTLMAACSHGERTGELEIAVLSGSTFEGSDGNLGVNGSGNDARDWANAPNRFAGIDRPSGSNDNSFGQGTKEDDSDVTIVTGSIPPNKNDLTRFYVASDVGNGENFLYLAWERALNTGNANLDFEINQKATTGFTGTATGPLTLNRTAGDILITYDFSGSGTPTLGINFWLTAAAGNDASQCFSAHSLPCWGKHRTLNGTNSEGAVNTAPVQDPISVPGAPNPPGTLGAGLFGEAAINLTKAGVFEAGTCTSFGSGFVKSRSSSSFTAEVKDFIAPLAPLHISNCEIALAKSVDEQNASPGGVLTYTLDYSNPGESALTDVVIEDPLPANTAFVSVASSPSIACTSPLVGAAGTVSCSVGTLAPGASGTVTIAVKLTFAFQPGDTTVTNVGTITSREMPPVSDDAITTVHVAAPELPPFIGVPALAIIKSVDKAIAAPGEELVYTLSYGNSGNAGALAVAIADSLPPGTTFVSVASSPPLTCNVPPVGSGGTVSCGVGTLAAGASGTVTITVDLDPALACGTSITNTAVIGSSEIGQSSSSEVTTTINIATAP